MANSRFLRRAGSFDYRILAFGGLWLLIVGLVPPAAADPEEPDCEASSTWFKKVAQGTVNTPLTDYFVLPPQHPDPTSDCGFYRPSWQTFLNVTQMVAHQNGHSIPRFLSSDYYEMHDVFPEDIARQFSRPATAGVLSLAPRGLETTNSLETNGLPDAQVTIAKAIDAGAAQAGGGGLLTTSDGSLVYYAIQMNQKFVSFLRRQHLTTPDRIKNAPSKLTFQIGSVELKSAWRIIGKPEDAPNYITTRAAIPIFKPDGDKLVLDDTKPAKEVTAAMLAMHVVFRLNGHPEFVWATFEHVDKDGKTDLAPSAPLPLDDFGLPGGVDVAVSSDNFVLYKANTLASRANFNSLPSQQDVDQKPVFDVDAQKFLLKGQPYQTSIYRVFPHSKASNNDEPDPEEDEAVVALNEAVHKNLPSDDVRQNYRLAGAIWLDKPHNNFYCHDQDKGTGPCTAFDNPKGVSSDEGPVAGEDRLSSLAMESFTQPSFHNCFSCHNIDQVKDGPNTLIGPKFLNVSHILSKFLSGK